MATKIVTKNSSTSGSAPLASDLVQGELAVNVTDKRLYTENASGTIVEVGTNPSTLTVTGEITASGGIALGDNDKATFGAGDDLQIYHDGSDSYVDDAGTGDLVLRGNNQVLIRDTGTNEVMGNFRSSGAVTLYYDNAEKISTTATGIDVTGDVSLGDNGKATFGAGDDLQLYHNGNNSFIEDVGTGNLYLRAANNIFIEGATANESMATFQENGFVKLFFNNEEKLATTSTGIDVTGTATMDGLTVDGASDLNGTITVGTTYTTDITGNDVSFFRDNGTSYIRQRGGQALALTTNDGSDRQRIKIDANGDISFYEDTGTTPKFFWDASAESLGIGTSTPTALLHLSSTAPSILMQDSDGTGRSSINCDNGSLNFKFNSNNAVGTSVLTFSDFNTERMRIDSSGNVGIGESSPQRALHVNAGSTDIVALLQSDTNAYLSFWDSVGGVKLGSESGSMVFYEGSNSTGAGGAEAMRIDASGNLLVGKTATGFGTAGIELRSNGELWATTGVTNSASFNRTGSYGAVITINSANTPVGSIGVNADRIYLSGASEGVYIDDSLNSLSPCTTTGGNYDNHMDLGGSSSRFKDLYLSGGVYLGGTGDANKLDDYEEGTWTPTLEGDTSGSAPLTVSAATYTKIGNTVNAYCYLSAIDLSADDIVGNMVIKGLPFNVATNNLQSVAITYQALSSTYLNMSGRITSGFIRLQQDSGNFSLARTDCSTVSGKAIMIGCTYPTNA